MENIMTIKILLADDHRIIRDGLRALLEKEADLEVIAEAATGTEAVKLAFELNPDVIIMDISMPDMNGIEATREIVLNSSDTRILALSMESDRRFIVEILKAGANGYLLKDSAFSELATAIRTVYSGETYLSSKVTEVIVKEYLQRTPSVDLLSCEELTAHERELLQLIAVGKSPKEIGFTFAVSLKTVENQRHNIMKKLNLFTIAELTKYAVREGLTSLN
jgi:DNA-binding NarL/FixJ family response regulator